MRKNLFEMGANFDNEWSSDNKNKTNKQTSHETKNPNEHRLHFAKEKRRGKTVTIVKPFFLPKSDISTLLKLLKKRLGTGGAIKGDSMELQGDIADSLRAQLEEIGYRFKK